MTGRLAGFDTGEALLAELRDGREGVLHRPRFHFTGRDPREAFRKNDRPDSDTRAGLRVRLAEPDENSGSERRISEALRLVGEHDSTVEQYCLAWSA